MTSDNRLIPLAKLLVTRLERLSADSKWAHQASGMRGDLIRIIELLELQDSNPKELVEIREAQIRDLMNVSFDILEKAARDLM